LYGSYLGSLASVSDYTKYDDDDNIYVNRPATDNYSIVYFNNRGEQSDDIITNEWKGKSSIATSTSIAKLDIWNHYERRWDNVDTDNATAAGTEFILGTTITDRPEPYIGSNLWSNARVWQKAQ
jgi:hypothetical protein